MADPIFYADPKLGVEQIRIERQGDILRLTQGSDGSRSIVFSYQAVGELFDCLLGAACETYAEQDDLRGGRKSLGKERLPSATEAEPIAPVPSQGESVPDEHWKAKAEEFAKVAMGNGQEIGRLLVVNATLGNALAKLTDACYAADACEELPDDIDGSMLDAAEAAIALIDKFPPVRAPSPTEGA